MVGEGAGSVHVAASEELRAGERWRVELRLPPEWSLGWSQASEGSNRTQPGLLQKRKEAICVQLWRGAHRPAVGQILLLLCGIDTLFQV